MERNEMSQITNELPQIINWTAKRAGGKITIYGVTKSTGNPIRIVGVDQIDAGRQITSDGLKSLPIATDKTGARYELA